MNRRIYVFRHLILNTMYCILYWICLWIEYFPAKNLLSNPLFHIFSNIISSETNFSTVFIIRHSIWKRLIWLWLGPSWWVITHAEMAKTWMYVKTKTLSMSSIGVLSASFIIRQNCHYLILSLYHLRHLMVAKQQI